jgi:hypothetical protein
MGEKRAPNDVPEEAATWPTRHQAATRLGVHVRTIDRMVASGELHPVFVQGVKRFEPGELESCNSEADADTAPILQTLNDSLRIAQDHAKSLLGSVTAPSKALLEMYMSECQRLRERCSQLEDKHLQQVQAYERLLSEANERELAAATQRAAAARADQATKLFFDMAPELLNQILAGSKVSRLVSGLTNDQMAVLRQADLLSEEQITQIENLRAAGIARERRAAPVIEPEPEVKPS